MQTSKTVNFLGDHEPDQHLDVAPTAWRKRGLSEKEKAVERGEAEGERHTQLSGLWETKTTEVLEKSDSQISVFVSSYVIVGGFPRSVLPVSDRKQTLFH